MVIEGITYLIGDERPQAIGTLFPSSLRVLTILDGGMENRRHTGSADLKSSTYMTSG